MSRPDLSGAAVPGPCGLDPAAAAVVIPAYNEGRMIAEVVRRVRARYPRVAVVDDGSDDDTAGEAHRAGATVLRHVVNRGQGAALQTGLAWGLRSGARWLVTFDADGQHRVEDIERLLATLTAPGCDVALGSRFLGGATRVPAGRRALLRGAVLFTRATSGLRVTDAHNGLRALTATAARRLDLRQDRMAHASEILDQIHRHRLAYVEVPVTIDYTAYSRAKGQSAWGALRIVFEYLVGRLFGPAG